MSTAFRLPAIAGAVIATCALVGLAAGASSAAPRASTGNTIVIAANGVPDDLVSIPWAGVASALVLNGLGSQLVGYNTSGLVGNGCQQPATNANLTGLLAQSIKVSPNQKLITMTLKPLKSPYGHTLSAADVAWSINRDIHLDSFAHDNLQSAGFDMAHLVTIVNPTTVELHVTHPSSYSLESLANNILNIYDSTEVKMHATAGDPWGNKWLSTNVADYSGWSLESFTPGTSLILDANPDWGGKRGNVTRIVVTNVPDPATRQQLVASGHADIAEGLDFTQYKSLAKTSGVRVINCKSFSRDTLLLNTTTTPLNNPQVRDAISLAIDRKAINEGAYDGLATVPTSETPSGLGIKSTHPYEYNPAKAKQELAAAGYPNGFTLDITYSPSRPGPVVDQSSVLLQSELAAVGIKVMLTQVVGSSDFSNLFYAKRFQALMFGNTVPLTDPAFNESVELTSKGPNNVTGFDSQAYDKLVATLTSTPATEVSKRDALMTQMDTIVQQQKPILTLVEPPNLLAVTSRVGQITPLTDGQLLWSELKVG